MAMKLKERSSENYAGNVSLLKGIMEIKPVVTDAGLSFKMDASPYYGNKDRSSLINELTPEQRKIYYFADYLNHENAKAKNFEKSWFSRIFGNRPRSTNDILKEYADLQLGNAADSQKADLIAKTIISLINDTDKEVKLNNGVRSFLSAGKNKEASDNMKNIALMKISRLKEDMRRKSN